MQHLSADDLLRMAEAGAEVESAACPACAALVCPGWESFPGGADEAALQPLGTLRHDPFDEPTYAEHHPNGTRYESPDAPVAPAFHPYNRCELWC